MNNSKSFISSVSFLEMYLKYYIDDDLSARLNDNFFLFYSTIPIDGVYISQLLRLAQACTLYSEIEHHRHHLFFQHNFRKTSTPW